MRRFFSITMVCALLASAATPLIAASCPHSKMTGAMACHRVEHAHHCDRMHEDSEQTPDTESSESTIASRPAAQDCPMDCCGPSQRTNAMTVAVSPIFSSMIVTEQVFENAPVVFTATGFSSHTDRGPPTV
jgi:hypothetical protein